MEGPKRTSRLQRSLQPQSNVGEVARAQPATSPRGRRRASPTPHRKRSVHAVIGLPGGSRRVAKELPQPSRPDRPTALPPAPGHPPRRYQEIPPEVLEGDGEGFQEAGEGDREQDQAEAAEVLEGDGDRLPKSWG